MSFVLLCGEANQLIEDIQGCSDAHKVSVDGQKKRLSVLTKQFEETKKALENHKPEAGDKTLKRARADQSFSDKDNGHQLEPSNKKSRKARLESSSDESEEEQGGSSTAPSGSRAASEEMPPDRVDSDEGASRGKEVVVVQDEVEESSSQEY